jgi:protease-4
VLGIVLRALYDLVRLPFWPLWIVIRYLTRPRGTWVHARIADVLTEIDVPPRPWLPLGRWIPALERRRATSIRRVARLVDVILADPGREGLLVEIGSLPGGWARIDALRRELERLRRGGKKVAVYLPQGGGNRELFLASVATQVITTEGATFFTLGVGATARYVKGLLDKLGVHVEVYRRAAYKSAAETFAADEMSDAQREQLGALLDAFDKTLVASLAERPGLDEAKVRALFERGAVSGQAAIESGLVDAHAFEDELPEVLGGKLVPAGAYLARADRRFFVPVFRQPFVAVVPIHGAIADAAGRGATRAALVPTLRRVARDPRALAVVLHVDSPGGSALASDLIHREVQRLRERKPVIACFGDVAASGGYYVAAPASDIVASRLSITGSIGVISARLVATSLLDRLGVRTEVVRRAPHADLLTNPRAADEAERALMDREIDAFYRTFVSVVAKGRRREETEVEPLARGRVWSGADAREKGLVDREGTLSDAIVLAKEKLTTLSAAAREALRVVTVVPQGGEEPPLEAEGALAMLANALDDDVAFLARAATGGERAMYYALGLPRIE